MWSISLGLINDQFILSCLFLKNIMLEMISNRGAFFKEAQKGFQTTIN